MNPTLPPRLKAAADALLEGVSRKDLAVNAGAISNHYRKGRDSALAVTDDAGALAYLVARLPATYAVAAAALAQVKQAAPDFAPALLLDVGAGPGTASWAARETWNLSCTTMMDSNTRFLNLARTLWQNEDTAADFVAHDLGHADDLPRADLVIASFVFAEIAKPAQQRTVEKLFAATSDTLVLIEPGTPQGFENIRAARAQLIGLGANVMAPCTHANRCPMTGTDWCHFSQRLPRSRDHMRAKGASVPYEDERYSWLAVSRARRSEFEGQARVLAPPREAKPGLTFKLCTPAGVEERFVARRDKAAFAVLRRKAWGGVA